jgi:ppGpp synthetase/RelA/SpoT-type nucleotidyltranferase
MEGQLSKTQIDRLGERLRAQDFGEAELTLLDEYRLTFGPAYDRVVERIQEVIGVPLSGRPAKSTSSIIEKLNRESIRLSQMQDVAGCRAMVSNVLEQDRAVAAISAAFADVSMFERRAKPSHGYRAVHVVIRESGKPIEVQVRTSLQHLWAEFSEKVADTFDPSLKYGGGPADARQALDGAATLIPNIEELEASLASRRDAGNDKILRELADLRMDYENVLQWFIKELERGLS